MIERHESHQHMRAMQMNVIAMLGLIGFGVFAVPVLTTHIQRDQIIATTVPVEAPQVRTFPHVSVVAHEALVYDLTAHTPLFEKNAQEALPLASLTKLLTVYGALTRLPENTTITITPDDLAPEGSSGLVAGETYSLTSLERIALVASSNDAAQAITQTIAVHEQKKDRDLLASVATALGLMQTRVNNGTGLDISQNESGAYGTAYDIANLAGAVVDKNPTLALATTRSTVSISSQSGQTISLPNTNHYISGIPNPLLSKTGYTDLAGGNLVVVFDAGLNHRIAVVVLGSTYDSRFSDVRTLVSKTLEYLAPPSAP